VSRPGAALAAFLEATLRIRPGEGRRTGLLFLHLLLASAVFILGRTVRDTLFLSRYPIVWLPWMFVFYGIVSSVVAVAYGRYADRVPRHRLIVGSAAIGIVTYLATWVLVRAGVSLVYPVFYVWAEVVANLFIVQFWTLANDLHDARAAKRLFGTIGSARVLGVVIVGLAAGEAVRAIGTAQLLFVLAALMAGIAGCAVLLGREPKAETGYRAGTRERLRGKAAPILADPYIRVLALMILLAFVSLTIGDYQFKRIARATFQEDALARFFSLFYAATGIVSFVFQLTLTPRILARLGVGAGMTVMPSVFGAASAALLFGPRLAVATVMKFADNGFQYTIHETTLQALYVPFGAAVKARTRAFLDAVVKPLSYGAGGLALVFLAPHVSVAHLGWVTVPLVVAWLLLVPVVKRRYLRTLEATLSARGALALDHEFLLDSDGRRVLVRTLETGTPRQILVALEQLGGERAAKVTEPVARLTTHPDPQVRAAALYRLAWAGGAGPATARTALTDPCAEVRAAAAAAYAALAKDEAVDELAPLLADPAPDVRVAALAGLLRDGGVEGGIVGGAELGRLLTSGRVEDRVAATRALRHLGTSAYRPVRRLLADPDATVRRAALKAALGVADARLVPALVQLLEDPACRYRAGQALIRVGRPAVPPLVALLGDAAAPRTVRLEAPRLLSRIPHEETYLCLREHLRVEDSHVRLRVCAALSRLRRELGRTAEPVAFVLDRVTAEVRESYANTAGWVRARPDYETPLMDELFAIRRAHAVKRVLRILELRYDREPLRLVRHTLGEPSRRANALEVLDTLLDPALRPVVMPFADEAPPAVMLARAGGLAPATVPEPAAFLAAHCRHPNPYVAMLALDALSRRRDAAVFGPARELVDHPDPMVREGARVALARLDGRERPEGLMYSTVEKILFLKSAPVFERVAGDDLAPLARIAEEEVVAPGSAITREGDPGDALYIIVRGRVQVSRDGVPLATLGAGDTLGEMSVFDGAPRSATGTALEETEVLRIGNEEFYEVLHEQVEIAEGVIRVLSDRIRNLDREVAERRAAGGTA
jgi:HEAT repeat protein/ATP/ADP translocase